MHMRDTHHFHRGLFLSNPKEKKKKFNEKQNYLHGKSPNKKKKNGKYFWVFFLIITTSMESKLIKSYN